MFGWARIPLLIIHPFVCLYRLDGGLNTWLEICTPSSILLWDLQDCPREFSFLSHTSVTNKQKQQVLSEHALYFQIHFAEYTMGYFVNPSMIRNLNLKWCILENSLYTLTSEIGSCMMTSLSVPLGVIVSIWFSMDGCQANVDTWCDL